MSVRILIIYLLFFIHNYSLGQNFSVTTTNDAVDANPGNGVCDDGSGSCTLRAAIQESNALGGNHTITLVAGNHTLTIAGIGEDGSASGDLDIAADIIINGLTPLTSIIDIDSLDRVFHILPGGNLSISNTTIKRGYSSRNHGGGFLNQGTLSITSSHVTENIATLPDGAFYSGGFGGGIANYGTLTIFNSTLFLNEAIGGRGVNGQDGGGGSGSTPGFGGAIYNDLTGIITITNTTISDNNARGGRFSGGAPNNGNWSVAGKQGAGPNGGTGGAAGAGAGGDGGD